MISLPELGSVESFSPDLIKERLPLTWMVGRVWGVYESANKMIPCPLPGHKDDTPSFNLWQVGKDGQPYKFGCFGCGQRGDVIDVVRIVHEVGFIEAMDIARSQYIPEFEGELEWEPPPPRELNERTVEDVRYDWSYIGLEHDTLTYSRYLHKRGLNFLRAYAREEWRWQGISKPPLLAAPHYSLEQELMGVKFRDVNNGGKYSIGGSSYKQLYGIWRDQGRDNIVLCEGESDTVWTAYQLRSRGVEVFGLATGTNQSPTDNALQSIGNRRVHIIFDGDQAGRRASEEWRNKLVGPTVLIKLPEGTDIISSGLTINEILSRRSDD